MPFAWDKERQLDMIEHPERWPRWPWLPLKRANHGGAYTFETGVLVDVDMAPTISAAMANTVFCTNVYNPEIKKCERHEYESMDALLDDGWVVD